MNKLTSLFKPSPVSFSTQQTLTIIGLAALTSLLLTMLPWLNLLNYPFRLLLTIVHELGHGLAALLTGGHFIDFVVYPNGAGLAHTAGGWRLVVIPAGYLGVALFGALLIMLGGSHRWARVTLGVIGVAMAALSLRYGIPTLFSLQILSGLLTIVSGVVFGGLLVWVALKATPGWIIFLAHFIAIQAVLTACSDLWGLIGLSARFLGMPENDARSMAELTYIPAIVWAVLWAILALVLVGGSIWLTWFEAGQVRKNPN